MASWSEVFKKALFTVAYSLGFSILGIIIIVLGITTSFGDPTSLPVVNYYTLIPSLVLGISVMAFGGFAAFYKVFFESSPGSSVVPKRSVSPASPNCPNCGTQNRAQARICRNCGAQLA